LDDIFYEKKQRIIKKIERKILGQKFYKPVECTNIFYIENTNYMIILLFESNVEKGIGISFYSIGKEMEEKLIKTIKYSIEQEQEVVDYFEKLMKIISIKKMFNVKNKI
jgi:hypothetical protein